MRFMIEAKKSTRCVVLLLAALMSTASFLYVFASMPVEAFHGVGVLKSADLYAAVGDAVTYVIRVYNPSDFDLHNINVTDSMIGLNVTIPFMAAHNQSGVVYTALRTVLESDPNPLINTVIVEAVDSEGIYSTASTQAKTTIVKRWIRLEKTGPMQAHEGDLIEYSIVIENVADVALNNVMLKDEALGLGWRGDLAVGESNEFNLTYFVHTGAEDPLVNTASIFAQAGETTIYAEQSWTVDILHPMLTVEKTVYPREVYAGQNVTYTVIANNTGDTALYNLTLFDSLQGFTPAELVPESLQPHESFAWVFNMSICRCVVNVAMATGVDALGKQVVACDKAYVRVKPCVCPRSIGYWKNHPKAWPTAELLAGNITLTKAEALAVLKGANARDATRMLAAQLIAAKLNRICGTCPFFVYCGNSVNIDNVIAEADVFLTQHPIGSYPQGEDRQTALWLKDVLDAYNNLKCS